MQKAFAGRTKTVRGPHEARVPVFGPRCGRQMTVSKFQCSVVLDEE